MAGRGASRLALKAFVQAKWHAPTFKCPSKHYTERLNGHRGGGNGSASFWQYPAAKSQQRLIHAIYDSCVYMTMRLAQEMSCLLTGDMFHILKHVADCRGRSAFISQLNAATQALWQPRFVWACLAHSHSRPPWPASHCWLERGIHPVNAPTNTWLNCFCLSWMNSMVQSPCHHSLTAALSSFHSASILWKYVFLMPQSLLQLYQILDSFKMFGRP